MKRIFLKRSSFLGHLSDGTLHSSPTVVVSLGLGVLRNVFAHLRCAFLLNANWHQKDRPLWQRQLGQYIASNSGQHFSFTNTKLKIPSVAIDRPLAKEQENANAK